MHESPINIRTLVNIGMRQDGDDFARYHMANVRRSYDRAFLDCQRHFLIQKAKKIRRGRNWVMRATGTRTSHGNYPISS